MPTLAEGHTISWRQRKLFHKILIIPFVMLKNKCNEFVFKLKF